MASHPMFMFKPNNPQLSHRRDWGLFFLLNQETLLQNTINLPWIYVDRRSFHGKMAFVTLFQIW